MGSGGLRYFCRRCPAIGGEVKGKTKRPKKRVGGREIKPFYSFRGSLCT